jgi:hypothetical protein
MNYEEFEAHFKPIQNHLNHDAPMNGVMFETYGEELAFVQEQNAENVWSVIVSDDNPYDTFVDNYECADCEDVCVCNRAREAADEEGLEPVWYLCKGFHVVNLHGYVITEVPWNENTPDAEY